jgi:hypothetical protein
LPVIGTGTGWESVGRSMAQLYAQAGNTSRTAVVTPLLPGFGHPGGGQMRALGNRLDALRRRFPSVGTVRVRLTALYGSLFLVSGAGLLAITYASAFGRGRLHADDRFRAHKHAPRRLVPDAPAWAI